MGYDCCRFDPQSGPPTAQDVAAETETGPGPQGAAGTGDVTEQQPGQEKGIRLFPVVRKKDQQAKENQLAL